MLNKNLALALGALTGLVSLVAMVRLVSGAFDGGLSVFAWVITLLAMVPWVGYAAVRARHGRLDPAQRAGRGWCWTWSALATVWFFVLGRGGRAGLLAGRVRGDLGQGLARPPGTR